MRLREEIIDALHQELGEERFRKFADALNRNGWCGKAPTFWQTQAWREFAAKHPNAHLSADDIWMVFEICSIHRRAIAAASHREPSPPFRATDEFRDAERRLFPYHGPLIGYPPVRKECPHGADLMRRWIEDHVSALSSLVRRTDLEEYLSHLSQPLLASINYNLARVRAGIALELASGGELWEFDAEGWDIGEGAGGVAVVRDGRMTKWWIIEFGDRDDPDSSEE